MTKKLLIIAAISAFALSVTIAGAQTATQSTTSSVSQTVTQVQQPASTSPQPQTATVPQIGSTNSCPSGQHLYNGSCVIDQQPGAQACLSGLHWYNGGCVPDMGTVTSSTPWFGPGQQGGQFTGPQWPSGPNQFMGNGMQGGGPDQGRFMNNPDSDRMQKIQQMEGQRDSERRLKDIRREMKMMDKEATRVQKRLDALAAKGIPISQDAKDALSKIKSAVDAVNGATSTDQLDSVDMSSFGDLMQTINEGMQKAEMAAQFPRILKSADKQLSRMQAMLKRAQSRAASIKVDTTSVLNDWKSALDNLQSVRDGAKQKFDSGDTDGAISDLQDDLFPNFDQVAQKAQNFEMMANTQKMAKTIASQVKQYQKIIAKLKKDGQDTSDLENNLNQFQSQADTVKGILSQSPVDYDQLSSAIEDLMSSKSDLDDSVSSLTGEGQVPSSIPGLNFQGFQMPKGFDSMMGGFGGGRNGPIGGQGGPTEGFQPGPMIPMTQGGPGFGPQGGPLQGGGPGGFQEGPQGGPSGGYQMPSQGGSKLQSNIFESIKQALAEITRKVQELQAQIPLAQ